LRLLEPLTFTGSGYPMKTTLNVSGKQAQMPSFGFKMVIWFLLTLNLLQLLKIPV
jgi:hypothetical protein